MTRSMTAKEQIQILTARQKTILGEDGYTPSSTELAEFDALEAAITKLSVTPRLARPAPFGQPDGRPGDHHRRSDNPRHARRLFRVESPEDYGFESLEDFARAIAFHQGDRLMAVTGQSIGVPADGGFAVPQTFAFEMLDRSLESEIVRPRCRVVPMLAETHNISTFADADHSAGELFGGLEGEWVPEGGTLTNKTAELRRVKLIAHKLGFLTSATNELLADAPGFEGQFAERMRAALSWNLDRTFLVTGSGAGQPRSILNDPACVTVSKEVGQAADTITYQNLTKMFARLHPGSMSSAVWVCNQTAIPQLLGLTIAVGTGGSFIPLMTETAGQFNILTRPVLFTEKLNPLGDLGDILLVDFTQYVAGIMHNGMRLDRSEHVAFTTDQMTWRLLLRADGQGTWESAFTPANGDTLSWCVTLAAR